MKKNRNVPLTITIFSQKKKKKKNYHMESIFVTGVEEIQLEINLQLRTFAQLNLMLREPLSTS